MTLPARALRTGTAVRPRPGSNAIATPTPPVTEPARVSAPPIRDRCPVWGGSATPSGPPAALAARQAAPASSASGSSAITAKPGARMARFTSTPGSGSASRAGPIGISGDAAMATATAMTPPARVTMASLASDSATRLARVAPIARSTGNSAESRASCRLSSWPMTASAMRPASAANAARAIASGRMACWVAATWAAWLMVRIWPLVSGYRFASAVAARERLSTVAPGRSRICASLP